MKQIIDEHKGDISIESERGRETSFSILLPARQSEQELEGKQTLKLMRPAKRANYGH